MRVREAGGTVTAVRACAFTGYRVAAVDLRLADLVIDAKASAGGGQIDLPQDVAPPADVATAVSRERHVVLGTFLFVAGILGLVGAATYVGRRRRAAAAPGRMSRTRTLTTGPAGRPAVPLPAVVVLVVAIFGCSIYANLAFAVQDPADLRCFPPFKRHVNTNMNGHLGAEYFNIAKALAAGEGFANPFPGRTGPTAWMTPVLPTFEAALLWFFGGDRDGVIAVVVLIQVLTLIATGILVLAVGRRTTNVGAVLATAVFLAGVVGDFHAWFQYTHDCWLVLLALDLLVAALVWREPLGSRATAIGWGLVGGLCALVSPVVGFVWGAATLRLGIRAGARSGFAVAAAVAVAVVAPWTVRNAVVLGRLIPVKSNAAYELYQSQCLTPDGLIRYSTWGQHPYHGGNREWHEYRELGEAAFVDHKREQFWTAVRADPQGFLDRVADRLFATTVWYSPMDQNEASDRPWVFWWKRVTFPLPFLSALLLVVTAIRRPLHAGQWTVLGVYALYLLPYVGVSYYERYAFPLVGVKVLLVLWGLDRLRTLAHYARPVAQRPRNLFASSPPVNGAAAMSRTGPDVAVS
jgi:hypothetical protein